jgi:predicted aminopeptidase
MPARTERRRTRAWAALAAGALAVATLAGGCSHVGYYVQSAQGQFDVSARSRPIAELIADPATDPKLRARLETVAAVRDYASRELGLPDNGSYRSYADLERPFVVWNVFAAGEFSVNAKQWCFPVAGCVGYRGYFSRADAEAFARQLATEGYEVYVGGVPAYSTLGWFDDPVLNTFVNYPDPELARLVFHELAHQVVYVRDDSAFNESFATAVELEGVKRWLAAAGRGGEYTAFETAQARRAQLAALVAKYRGALAAAYRAEASPEAKRAEKARLYGAMQADYATLKASWGGFAGYDRFFDGANNARLASVGLYSELVPAFQGLLAAEGGDLGRFYVRVKALAAEPRAERRAALARLAPAIAAEPR